MSAVLCTPAVGLYRVDSLVRYDGAPLGLRPVTACVTCDPASGGVDFEDLDGEYFADLDDVFGPFLVGVGQLGVVDQCLETVLGVLDADEGAERDELRDGAGDDLTDLPRAIHTSIAAVPPPAATPRVDAPRFGDVLRQCQSHQTTRKQEKR